MRFTDIGNNPQRSHQHVESSSARENNSLPFRFEKSSSAGDLHSKRSRPPESVYDIHERHLSEASKTAEAHRRFDQMSELSNTGEILRKSERNADSVNFVASQEDRLLKRHEFLSDNSGLLQKSLVGQELSNTLECSQRSTIGCDSQTIRNTSQRLANVASSFTNPPRTAPSLPMVSTDFLQSYLVSSCVILSCVIRSDF